MGVVVKTSPTHANLGSTGGVPRSRNRGGAWRSKGSELEPPLSERSRGTRPKKTKHYPVTGLPHQNVLPWVSRQHLHHHHPPPPFPKSGLCLFL